MFFKVYLLYLLWFSAWAWLMSAISSSYTQIKKILLIALGYKKVWIDPIKEWLSEFEWECYVAIWANDETVWLETWDYFAYMANRAKLIESILIENCDHQFRWSKNWKILSHLAISAFSDDIPFEISEKKGIKLYD